jgi:hypothetical protein
VTNYRRADEDVEVLVDDTWHPGHLRAWDQRDDEWWGSVMWSAGTAQNRLDWFPADRIRKGGDYGGANDGKRPNAHHLATPLVREDRSH